MIKLENNRQLPLYSLETGAFLSDLCATTRGGGTVCVFGCLLVSRACIYYLRCALERVLPHRCGCFPSDERKANLLAGPGNIRAGVPAGGHVIISHRAGLREPGNEGTDCRMPSHPPPRPPSLPSSCYSSYSSSTK